MNFSKRMAHWMTTMVSGFVLSACIPNTQERPDGVTNDAANFAIVSVSGSIGGNKNVGEFPFPGEKTYNFKACLVDYTRRTNIPNAKFQIKEIDQEVTTDAQGCLNWPETIKFNYLADSVWLKLTRTFEAKGLQRGSREAKLAINPWSHGEGLSEVMDLMKQTTPYLLENDDDVKKHLAGLDKDGKPKMRKRWVENGERIVTNFKTAAGPVYQWHDQIFLKPQILFGRTDSSPVLLPVLGGFFNVEVSLIVEDVQNQKTVRHQYAKQIKEKVVISNTTLMVDVDFSLDKIPTSGQTFLGIKLIPIGAPEGLQPFEGLFPLGNDHSFVQSTGLKISETVASENRTGQFTLQNFLGSKEAAAQMLGVKGSSIALPGQAPLNQEAAGIYAGYLEVGDAKIANENGQKKVLSYPVHTCLSSRAGNIGLNNRSFTVVSTGPDGKVLDAKQPNFVTTGKTNCLYWEVLTPEFDRNKCQHYFPISIRIENKDLGMDQTETVLVNPWSMNGLDRRKAQEGTNQYHLTCEGLKNPLKVNNVINIPSITLRKDLFRPQVLDRSLQLTQKGIYGVRLNGVTVRDYSDEHAGAEGAVRSLRVAPYLLRLVFVRSANTRSDNGYVTHANVIMKVDGGNLDGEMEITIKDLQSTLARKVLLAQLFPIDMAKFQSKEWKNNDPNIEDLIDRSTALISPLYAAKTVVLGNPLTTVALSKGVDDISDVPGLSQNIVQGAKRNPESSTLLNDIIKAGEASQAAMITKTAFKETDGKAWQKWSQEQNLQLTWMSDEKSVQHLQHQFSLQGDAKGALQNLIEINKLDDKWAKQFCQILIDGPWKGLLRPTPAISRQKGYPDNRTLFLSACQSIIAKNSSAFFKKSAVYRILSMQPAVLNPTKIAVSSLSVSSGFGFSAGHTEMAGTQGGLTVSGQAGASGAFGGASLGASYGTVVIQTTDRNRHSGTDIGESVSLSVTRWQFDIPATRYQKCTMLRANPDVFLFEKEIGWKSMFPKWITEPEVSRMHNLIDTSFLYRPYIANNPLFRGWLICSDKVSTQPVSIPETYFMVSQGNGDSETYDSMDEINRQFFLPIRGISDMARFKGILGESRGYPQDGELSDTLKADLAADISPLIRRIDPAPGMVLYDPAFQVPKLFSDESREKK
ncbi:MAG: hypothetical protein ACXWC9_00725 [Pseudobdellovibrionaceae bacterium]